MMCAKPCPMKICCLARLSDPTIIGCTIPEYTAGKIRRQEIIVWHRIREDNMKEICKNCEWAKPTYKGYICGKTKKKTKNAGTCESFSGKR